MALEIRTARVRDRNTVEPVLGAVAAVRTQAAATFLSPDVEGESSAITHGFQISTLNTGHTAYFDSGLGRAVVDGDLTVSNSLVSTSDFVANNGTITKRWFKNGIIIDRTGVTFTACRFDDGVSGFYSGTHRPFTLNWCTINTPGAAGDDGIQYQDYTAYRCQVGGNSDGAKINGGCTLTECFIRCEAQSSDDHNDGLQAVGSYTGNAVTRCNIDCRPPGGGGGPNAAILVADSSSGSQVWNDNFLAGGGYVMRCHEDSTYNVQGNWVLNGSWIFGAATRAVIPQSNLTWGTVRANKIVDASGNEISTISAP